jgi:hypothetical protein
MIDVGGLAKTLLIGMAYQLLRLFSIFKSQASARDMPYIKDTAEIFG